MLIDTELLAQYSNSKRGLSVRTKEEYLNDINILLRSLPVENLSDITVDHIERFLDSRHVSSSLVNRRLSAFNSFFKYLMRRGLVQSNPSSLVERQRMNSTLPRVLDQKKMEKLRKACKTPVAQAIVEILYNTGARFSEIQSCDLDDINLEDMTLRVLGKGGTERLIPVSSSLIPLITAYLQWRLERVKDDETALFITPTRGRRISKSWLSKLMASLRTATGIIGFRAHLLRHTFATDAINRGAKRESVQVMLGHKRPSTTDIYIHITPDVREDHRKAFP